MKKVGIIDYYLDEFHAHKSMQTLPNYNKENGTDYQVAAAYAEIDKENGLSSKEFCDKYGLAFCSTIQDLCEAVDYIMIFAPDNPEKKEWYALQAIQYADKKPIFLDKTFTDTYASAVRIYEAAKAAETPLFSASSLRYATEFTPYLGTCKSVLAFGSGVEMKDYAVHYLEIAITCMGMGIDTVQWEQRGQQEWVHLTYLDGRKATLVISMGEWLPFHVFLADKNGVTANLPITSQLFACQIKDVINFFETGKPAFDRMETLELMKARDGIFASKEKDGICVKLERN